MKHSALLAAILLTGWVAATHLCAEESIEELLKTYRKEADLSKRTKKENAGFVVVYTRDDLERMQVYRLSDILRHLRFNTYKLNNFGMVDPNHQEPYFYNSDTIKVYVNDHEITSGFSGSGLQFYGNVDMGMFDHVEVYYHAPVLDIATEPAAVLIKLYTKSPERENGGSLVGRLGERGTQEVALSHAKVLEKWSYFAYAEESENNYRHDTNTVPQLGQSYQISRDYSQQHVYLDLHRDKQRVELEYLGQKHDPFTAQSLWLTPTGGDWKQPMLRASYSGDFLNDDLHLDASYIYSDLTFDMTSDGPFWGQLLPGFNASIGAVNRFHLKVDGDLFTLKGFYKLHPLPDHLLKIGAEYRYKKATTHDYYFNDTQAPVKSANMDYYSFYLQDQYQIYPNAMFSMSLKYNYYDFSRTSVNDEAQDSLSTWQGRVAYSYLREGWFFNAYGTHVEFPTQLYVLVMHDYDLESQKYDTIAVELKRMLDQNDIRLFLSYCWVNDAIKMDLLRVPFPEKVDFRMSNISFDVTHRFNDDHRVDFNLNWTKYEEIVLSQSGYLSGYLRFLDTFGDFDIFNDLIFREGTPTLDAGWDYSAGVSYHATKDLKISLKGTNLLSEAQEEAFLTPGLNPDNYVTLPIVDKQVYLSVEWLF